MQKREFNKKLIGIVAAAMAVLILIMIAAVYTAKNENMISNETTAAVTTEILSETTNVNKEDWNLILVNKDNYVPENYNINLLKLKNGLEIDERCYENLQQMMDDCRADGLEPVICSAYRTQEKQTELYNRQIEKWKNLGYSDSEAKIEAGKLVAVPGTSEHQLGLAVDIVDVTYQILDENQENTQVQKWLMENSWKYGFILRYPTDKREITGITYEPWHYRYIGKKDAQAIYESGLCLEEYLMQ